MKLTILPSLLATACVANVATTSSSQEVSHDLCPANVPASLTPAADQDLAFALDATGVQKYTCAATATSYAWTFIAPDAQLYLQNNSNEAVGHHFAGPTWEWYEDGSTVVGKKVAAATVDPASIPWLLLTAASHNDLDGRMTKITSIQRLETAGGNAPATGCDADHVGAAADVPYTATYFFYRTRNVNKSNNVRCGG
jgi:hypothetical protein